MKILGIDPGLHRVGFGLIEQNAQQRYYAMDWGVITTNPKETEACRLQGIYNTLSELIQHVKPDVAAIEKLFFFRNATTMVPVSQARGVIILALYNAGIPYTEYTPMQVKMNLTGFGKAKKDEVQSMVQHILGMNELPKPDDAADALAIALSSAYDQGSISLALSR